MKIPTFKEAVCTAGQVSAILARPRPTITGWINRYDWLGIPGVVPGSTRMFSCADIGNLVALRMAITAGNMTETLGDSIELIEREIEVEFVNLMNQMQLDETGASGTILPRLPDLECKLRLEAHGTGIDSSIAGNMFMPTRSDSTGSYIADLAGYQLPETVLHLGQGLRNAWTRTLYVLNGFDLGN